ncbi:MAG: 4Fe-4S dicluster domain-containing protein [Holophagaceae bacterium]|uniref:4Fe-4S dicluster domain-containing protein n=1 Tax=Candidatus Geothrix skivensis TaxID=2954439 RepID=A0A9D7SFC3_9BACT|nr:4Fe-4S dicluster domain-containing protein [Candidatus Geothrix skivensis]
MNSGSHHDHHEDTLAWRIQQATGVKLAHCYQCGKCAAGCPVADQMDLPPCQVFRMLQYGLPEYDKRVLESEGIWLCLACETCSTRCPQEVEIPKVMDFIRGEALRLNLAHPRSRDILAFHRAFLDSIEYTGRLYEVGLVADYKVRSRHFLKDVMLAPKMYVKGKLGLLPHLIKNRRGMKHLFKHTIGKG